jgi:CelD/BcsL family acetyltransferase involved in cellulose biosynthesis
VALKVQIKSLQTTPIDSVSELSPFLHAWRELARGAPMQSPEWLLTWWEVFSKPEDELCLLLFHGARGELVGLAPLYLQGKGGHATFRILGVADNCTHHMTWLCVPGMEVLIGTEVARFLYNCRTNWKRLFFESVDANATAIHATVHRLAEKGLLYHQRQINSCWAIVLPSTWDEYLQTLSRSLRKRCRKLQRQFLDSGIIKVRQAGTGSELKEGFEILLKLHSARWGKTAGAQGVFADDKFRSFHEQVSKEFLARKQLRLAWLECEGNPIAIEYQFFDARAVYAYQAGIDLPLDNEYSPGKLTMMVAIQFAIARGCICFDLLCGDEPYKANWRAVPVQCHELRVWPRRGMGYVEWVNWKGYSMVVHWLKPVIPQVLVHRALTMFRVLKNVLST